MKKVFLIVFATAVVLNAYSQQISKVLVIPRPLSVKMTDDGQFSIVKTTTIVAANKATIEAAAIFNQFFKQEYGYDLPVRGIGSRNVIILDASDSNATDENYNLKVSINSIKITGSKKGVLYGLVSLLQMIQSKNRQLFVKSVLIDDEPAFHYRGLMLDVCRHFFDIDEIKKILDMMAYMKLNKFHWHLSDDQGWRIEIKKYPKLTSVSAWRDSSIVGQYGQFKPFVYDGERHGGFYTQDQIREIVAYAARRNIDILPEIEMPGHATAALAGYPELGNGAASYQVPGFWGVHKTIFSPSDATFTFLENVLKEVLALFPYEYIHVGGDEVPKDEWKNSALAKKIIDENHLKNEEELQSWFIQRMEKFLNKNGRKMVGWDEILEGGLSPNATVMSWRGEKGGIEAAKQNHNVIMSPTTNMYLDYAQSKDKSGEPLTIGGYLPLDVVYNYHPQPEELSAEQKKFVMGVQANTWTEYIPNNKKLEYMMFPRAVAVAEIGWTAEKNKNFDDFRLNRMPKLLNHFEKIGMNFRIPEANISMEIDAATGRRKVVMNSLVDGSRINYTIDGSKVDNTASRYNFPVLLPFTNQPLTLNYIITTAGNRSSAEYHFEIK